MVTTRSVIIFACAMVMGGNVLAMSIEDREKEWGVKFFKRTFKPKVTGFIQPTGMNAVSVTTADHRDVRVTMRMINVAKTFCAFRQSVYPIVRIDDREGLLGLHLGYPGSYEIAVPDNVNVTVNNPYGDTMLETDHAQVEVCYDDGGSTHSKEIFLYRNNEEENPPIVSLLTRNGKITIPPNGEEIGVHSMEVKSKRRRLHS